MSGASQDPVEYLKGMVAAYEASYGREVAQSLAAYYVPYFSQMGIDVSGILDRQAHQPEREEGDRRRGSERSRHADRDRRDRHYSRRRSASPRHQRK